ncbi:MAG TPA: MFS transporter [bacterium]|nr:MFS transporter [bacterium]
MKQPWLTRGVLAIGLASLFSDLGHEAATAILPLFLVSIGGSPFALGLIEGIAESAKSIAKLAGGYVGGRVERRKYLASSGYVVTALGIGSFALATGWLQVLAGRTVAWIGRGFREPIRDGLLADQTRPAQYGTAFGFERAMDTAGAILGPLAALGLLALATPLRTILALTIVPGTAAGLFILLVREKRTGRRLTSFWTQAVALPREFRRFLVVVGIFGLGDFSRTLLILWALGLGVQISGSGQMTLPIALYVGYNVVGSVSAYVAGTWSDRIGRRRILIGGYAVAAVVSGLMALDVRPFLILAAVFVGSGIYIGVEEAIEKAVAADLLPADGRTFGFGVLATVNGVGDFVASALVGLLWQTAGAPVAFGSAAAISLIGTVALARLKFRARDGTASA